VGLQLMKKAFWEKEAPKDSGDRHMSRKQVTSAKASARAAGRPWPNLVDNVTAMRAGRKKDKA
jgi:hypothetical protein